MIKMNIKKYLIPNADLLIAFILSTGFGVIANRFILGGQDIIDILLYMQAAVNHVENTYILNRYFHVFMEEIFIRLSSNPEAGLQMFWAFLMSTSMFLVYYNARSFNNKKNIFLGVLAVGLFFSVRFLALEHGVAIVDISAMMMVLVVLTIFLISNKHQHQSKLLLMSLGFVFFLAFKTKETTILTSVLFIGIGYSNNGFKFKLLFSRLLYVFAGILAAIIFFSILSWIMLGDPFFGLRPKEVYDFLTTYVAGAPNNKINETVLSNYYLSYFFQDLYIPFTLYIISGVVFGANLDPSRRLVWWLPLFITIFVTLAASVSWGPRFLVPAVPIICILGPQFLTLEIPKPWNERVKAGSLFFLTTIILIIIRVAIRFIIPSIGMDINVFLVNIYEPLILSAILAIVFFWKKFSLHLSILIMVLIIAALVSPIITDVKIMFKNHANLQPSQAIFYPFSAFSNEIKFTPGMKMLVSLDAWSAVERAQYAKNVDEVKLLFNVYFDEGSVRSNYQIDNTFGNLQTDILQSGFDYVLISYQDWSQLSSNVKIDDYLVQKFTILTEPRDLVVLLQAK